MSRPSRGLVIGGGIAGPALAVFLARRGIEPVVVEAYPRTPGVGAAFQIAPNGMRVLAALGLADQVIAAGQTARGFVFRNHRGKTIGVVPCDSALPAVNVARAPLHALLEQAMEREGITTHHARRLVTIETDATGVTAVFEDGGRERGDFLVGADGVRSRVRAWMLPDEAAPRDTRLVSIGAFCAPGTPPDLAGEDPAQVTFLVGPRHQLGYMKMASDTWAWWCHLDFADDQDREALLTMPGDALRDRMRARYEGWSPPAGSLIARSERWLRTGILDVPRLTTWHRGRVGLIGDAAHAMSSAGGQGASMALEDAMLLADLLGSHPHEHAFAAFERLRKPRAEATVRQAHANDRRTLQTLGPARLWLRDHVVMPLFAPVMTRIFRKIYAGEPALRDRTTGVVSEG